MFRYLIARRALDELADESIKKNMLNKIPQRLLNKLYTQGGDISFNVENNSYTISGCSKALADEINGFLTSKK